MRFYQEDNVFDAALKRINWLFDEFENVFVCTSGGKDSTVCFNLAMMVAEQRGRLPLDVLFIDQEAEWASTIDYVRIVMTDPRVRPHWLQVPIVLFNATSNDDAWLNCWAPGEKWMRERETYSIHENTFGTNRFKELFAAFFAKTFPGKPVANIGGVRCEESPSRARALTAYETYKGETWGKVNNGKWGQYTFYPIYDWSYTDVWKAIHEHGWPYCKLYDYMYQYGISPMNMRVSNVHHETAFQNLYFLQEIEAETWERLTERVQGINTAGIMSEQYMGPKELPPMFETWTEYRDYLVENLIAEEHRPYFRKTLKEMDDNYVEAAKPQLLKAQLSAILSNDYHGTKFAVMRAHMNKFHKKAGSRLANKEVLEMMRRKGDAAILARESEVGI